jgi:hypothetical protein
MPTKFDLIGALSVERFEAKPGEEWQTQLDTMSAGVFCPALSWVIPIKKSKSFVEVVVCSYGSNNFSLPYLALTIPPPAPVAPPSVPTPEPAELVNTPEIATLSAASVQQFDPLDIVAVHGDMDALKALLSMKDLL